MKTVSMTLILLFAPAAQAIAGPDWIEGTNGSGDAGRLPPEAQETEGNGPLETISGELEGLAASGLPDLQDMYSFIIEEPTIFMATSADILGGFAEFDSRLYLFDEEGNGLLGNDNTFIPGAAGGKGEFSFGSTLGNASNDGTMIVILDPGIYHLVITVVPQEPISMSGAIFSFDSDLEISGPDGPGGDDPIIDWQEEDGGFPACNPEAGSCCIANESPGCNDPACCEAICLEFPFCCEIDWDGKCAGIAFDVCPDICGGAAGGGAYTILLTGVTFAQPEVLDVPVDIKPGGCPNPFNPTSNGVLPVGLLGSVDFDADDVDVSTVQISRADGIGGSVAPLNGPPGPHPVLSDVGTPAKGKECDCHELEGDGITDWNLKFKTQDLVDILEIDKMPNGSVLELVVSGEMFNGTLISGSDCVVLVPPGAVRNDFTVSSNLAESFVEISPLDVTLDGDGFTNLQRSYYTGTTVTVNVPSPDAGGPALRVPAPPFVRWVVNGQPQPIGQSLVTVTVLEDMNIEAEYELIDDAPDVAF